MIFGSHCWCWWGIWLVIQMQPCLGSVSDDTLDEKEIRLSDQRALTTDGLHPWKYVAVLSLRMSSSGVVMVAVVWLRFG